MEITLPFLNNTTGLGDAVKAVTTAIGIKPCGGCQKRAEILNAAVQFTPSSRAPIARRSPAQWTEPPAVPEGWELEESQGDARLFKHTASGARIVWSVKNGRYSASHSFCCGPAQARAEFERRCQLQ